MTPTQEYVEILTRLKAGELGLLRKHAGQGLDETVDGFDLFAGVWWPLRQRNQFAPRREVAWLIAKLYAYCPILQSPDHTLARQLRACRPGGESERERFARRFDRMLFLPISNIEPALRWALDLVAASDPKLDWVKLTNDLSWWGRERTRVKWAEQFIENDERSPSC